MKNKIFISGIFALLILSGCQKLDQEIVMSLNKKQVINDYENVKSLQTAVYGSLTNGFMPIGGAMMASASDEAEHTWETSSMQAFNNGSWNAYGNPDDSWNHYFRAIRNANIFLVSADSVNLDLYKLDPLPARQIVYQSRLAEIKNWKYEVRFLRAFFYFELVKRYGGVPILTSAGSINDDYSKTKRNSLAECFKFISDECDFASANLPAKYSLDNDFGRITKGAALALKSRMLLYAASDLYNSTAWASGYTNPELISATGGDRKVKWQLAANAAKAVIDLSEAGYSLSTNYGSLFGSSTYNNPEVIFRRGNGNDNSFEIASTPVGYDMGQSGTTPSQNLVDDYEVKVDAFTSVPFSWSNPEHAANPYLNRDPRLGYSVFTNNALLKGRPIQAWVGGLDGKPRANATKTGYYLKKYVDTELDLLLGQSSNHAWIFFRLSEMYLNYAEALNEADPGNPDIKSYVDMIRQRDDVAMPALTEGLTQAQMRNAIRHERRIEFAFEDHRFWDVRRWMVGETYFNVPLKGVAITKTTDGNFTYRVTNIEERVFQPKMYFYPIPQSELFIAINWPQNPGW